MKIAQKKQTNLFLRNIFMKFFDICLIDHACCQILLKMKQINENNVRNKFIDIIAFYINGKLMKGGRDKDFRIIIIREK